MTPAPAQAAPTLTEATAEVAGADRDLLAAVDHWLEVMLSRLDVLSESLEEHIAETESHDGLFASVITDAPHLMNRVRRLTREHDDLIELIEQARDAATGPAASSDPHQVKTVHVTVHELIERMERHLHENCRLTQDAVGIDLGGPVG